MTADSKGNGQKNRNEVSMPELKTPPTPRINYRLIELGHQKKQGDTPVKKHRPAGYKA